MQRPYASWGKGVFLLHFTVFLKFLEHKQSVLLSNFILSVPQCAKTNSPLSHCFPDHRKIQTVSLRFVFLKQYVLWSPVWSSSCLIACLCILWLCMKMFLWIFPHRNEDLLTFRGADLPQFIQNLSSLSQP